MLRSHDLTAARAHGIVQACLPRQILVSADRAYQGANATFRTPYYHHNEQPERYQQFNRDHARLRAPGERAFAQLKFWRLLWRARCSTRRIGTIVQAIHTLMTCDYSG
jgi:DDE superfamily endonuclease